VIPSRVIAFVLSLVVFTAPRLPAQNPGMPEDLRKIGLLYNSFKDEEAYAACNEYLVSHPGTPIIVEMRARCLRNLGRYDEAVQALKQLPTRPSSAKLLLAECLANVKDGGPEAEQIVNEVAADDPNGIAARVTRARIYVTLRKFDQAASELKYAITLSPKNFEANLLAAFMTDLSGQFDKALSMYLPLNQNSKEYEVSDAHLLRDSLVLLAGVYLKMQQYDSSIMIWEQICERFPDNAGYLLQLGVAQALRYRFAEAIATLEKGVKVAPNAPELRWRLGDLYRSQGRGDDAIAQFEALHGLNMPQYDVIAELRLGELHLENGTLDKAKLELETALTIAPESGDVLEAIGKLREKLGDLPGAKAAYRKAMGISLAKNLLDFDSLYRLALLLSKSEDPAEQTEGAQLLERNNRIQRFMQEIERTRQEVEVTPNSSTLNTRMAGLLNLAGEYDLAKVWIERALRINRFDPRALIQAAYILGNLKDDATALRFFEQARQRFPKADVERKADYVLEIDGYIETLKKASS